MFSLHHQKDGKGTKVSSSLSRINCTVSQHIPLCSICPLQSILHLNFQDLSLICYSSVWNSSEAPNYLQDSNLLNAEYEGNSSLLAPCFMPQEHPGACQSVQFSRLVVYDSLWPHESQHARPPCPSPAPRVYSNSCPLSRWCHPAISSFVVPFSSCPQSLPASGSFPMSQLLTRGGQSTGILASASVLPMNTQDWSPLGWTGWISLKSKGLSRVFSKLVGPCNYLAFLHLSGFAVAFHSTLECLTPRSCVTLGRYLSFWTLVS